MVDASRVINPASLPESLWLGKIPVVMVHHIHVLVSDLQEVRQTIEAMPGVEKAELHDVQAFNGELALMVYARPVSVEFIQVVNPEIGNARLIKDEPLGFNALDFLVKDRDAAVNAAKEAGFILTGEMVIYGCREIWMRHPGLNLNVEFMTMPPAGYVPGTDPEKDKAKVWIYGLDGTENLYFE